MLTVTVDSSSVMARLDSMPAKLHDELLKTINDLTQQLRTYVITQKLSGQVLNFHTHHLQQSIQTDVQDSGSSIIGKVYNEGSIAPYGGIQEYGGYIPPHIIEPKTAEALHFFVDGHEVFAKRVNWPGATIPERSYLRSSLADEADMLKQEMEMAVARGLA